MEKKKKSNRINIQFISVAACSAAAVVFGLIIFALAREQGHLLPPWIKWSKMRQYENGFVCIVENKKCRVDDSKGLCLFQSDSGQKVQSAFLGDIDDDGHTELVMLLWKQGSYGDHLPFWVKENDHEWGQHIFIYRFDEKCGMIWGSSILPFEIKSLDYNAQSRVIHIHDTYDGESDWAWLSWGLVDIS